jgi:hypothetical protein
VVEGSEAVGESAGLSMRRLTAAVPPLLIRWVSNLASEQDFPRDTLGLVADADPSVLPSAHRHQAIDQGRSAGIECRSPRLFCQTANLWPFNTAAGATTTDGTRNAAGALAAPSGFAEPSREYARISAEALSPARHWPALAS